MISGREKGGSCRNNQSSKQSRYRYCIVYKYIAPEKNWADLSLGCEPLNWDCVEMARLR